MSDETGRAVRVTIFGEEYTIRSEMGEEYTRSCARHVDEAIQSAHVKSHVQDPHRAAILAAMEITDELMRTRSELDALQAELEERIEGLTREVEEAVDEPS